MSGHSRRSGKAAAVQELAEHLGLGHPGSPGGTIPKSWLEAVIVTAFGPDLLLPDAGKRALLKIAIEAAGGEWQDGYVTAHGSTITGEAVAQLTTLLRARQRMEETDQDLPQKTNPQPRRGNMTSESPDTNTEGLDSEASEDLEPSLLAIAAQLSELSQASEYPTGFSTGRAPFEPDEVSFDASGWLQQVAQVEAWLRLDQELPRSADPDELGSALFTALGVEPAEGLETTSDGTLRPTPLGVDVLGARLDIAAALCGEFQGQMESLSRTQATQAWTERWEEEQQFGQAKPEPIKARTSMWDIPSFSNRAVRGKLNLSPSYQRGDVWPTAHSQKLIESVLRGIPLPSIILLRPQSGQSDGAYEVVDGKQRLTAILRFIGKHPEAVKRVREADSLLGQVELELTFRDDYKKFRRLWKLHVGENLTATKEAEYYFPFKLATAKRAPAYSGDLEVLAGRYYSEIREESIHIADATETLYDVFEAGGSSYTIPIIEYTDATPRQIHEVFHLYNRQGKHLIAEEIRNALFHELDLMRLLLVASGDNANVSELAGYLDDADRARLTNIASALTGYRFGVSRYKRTKLLSWLTALVVRPSLQEDGTLAIRSTAKQIDDMLHSIEDGIRSDGSHPLDGPVHLGRLVRDLHRCLETHSSCASWAGVFKDDKDGAKWQELQLVASLVGVFLICAVTEDPEDLLEELHAELLEFTTNHRRPTKTQNKTQWRFIGRVALGLVDLAGVDQEALENTLLARYGVSCLPTLRAAVLEHEHEASRIEN